MREMKQRALALLLALMMSATFAVGGLTPVYAAEAPESAAEGEAPREEGGGNSAVLPEGPTDEPEEPAGPPEGPDAPGEAGADEAQSAGAAGDEAPDAAPDPASLAEILEAAESDGALAAELLEAIADEDGYLEALRAVLDYYYGQANEHAAFGAFAAGVGPRGQQTLQNYAEAAAERELDEDALGYVPGQVLVTFAPAVSEPEAEALLEEQHAEAEREVAPAAGEEVVMVAEASLEYTVEQAVAELEAQPGVLAAQPVFVYHTTDEPVGTETEAAVPNDSYAKNTTDLDYYMWAINAVNALEAWETLDALPAREPVKVAVIDTTQNFNQLDLQKNVLWDDFWSFQKTNISSGGSGVRPAVDLKSGHGTHVTGIIAATANNARGTFGVASGYDNNFVRVLPINAFNFADGSTSVYGTASSDCLAAAIDYAVAQGAKIINLSLGYMAEANSSYPGGYKPVDTYMNNAVDRAVAAGVTVIAAAGNNASNKPHYPSDLDNVIGVINVSERVNYNKSPADTGPYIYNKYSEPQRWSTSNYARGTEKDISAPGAHILSTGNTQSLTGTNHYVYMNGTSMACPVVSAVAALVLYARPDLTPTELRHLLTTTARDLGPAGYDADTAWGLVDAQAAVEGTFGIVFTATAATATDIELSWIPVAGAEGYVVEGSTTSATAGFVQLAELNAADFAGQGRIRYVDKNPVLGETVYYRMAPVYGGVAGEWTQVASATRAFPAPKILRRAAYTVSDVRLSWNAVAGADGYYVYKGGSAGGAFTQVADVSGPGCTLSGADAGNFYYKVTPYKNLDGGETLTGTQSGALHAPVRPAVPAGFSATAVAAACVKLQWQPVTGMGDRYIIYRSTLGADFDPEDSGVVSFTVTGLAQGEYLDRTTQPDTRYFYKIAVKSGAEKGADSSEFSAAASATAVFAAPAQVKATPAAEGITLSWSAVEGAEGYSIYLTTTGQAAGYSLIGTVAGGDTLSHTITDADPTENLYYAVHAWAQRGTNYAKGSLRAVAGYTRTLLAQPGALTATAGRRDAVLLSWNAVTGATGYEVYAAASDEVEIIPANLLATTTTNTYSHVPEDGVWRSWYRVRPARLPQNGLEGDRVTDYGTPTDVTAGSVSPPAPQGLAAESTGYDTIALSWGAVPGVDGYYLYRATAEDGPYTLAGIVKNGDTARFEDVGLAFNKSYWYRLHSYTGGSEQVVSATCRQAGPVTTALAAPANLTATTTGVGLHAVRLEWEAVKGASGYTVYRAGSPAGPFTKAYKSLNAKTTTLLDAPVPDGQWYYKVAAWRKSGSKKLEAAAPVVGAVPSTLAAPAGLMVRADQRNDYTVSLLWEPVEGAAGYYVYRSDRGDLDDSEAGYEESFKLVKTLAGAAKNSWDDVNLAAGRHHYRVAAYATVKGKKQAGAFSNDISAMASGVATETDLSLQAEDALYGATLTWNGVNPKADGYHVYRSAVNTVEGEAGFEKGFKKVATVSASTAKETSPHFEWSDGPLAAGAYVYRVAPYAKAGSKKLEGTFTQVSAQAKALAAVAPRVGTSAAYYAALEWDKVADATGYYIYRTAATATDVNYEKSFKRVATVTGAVEGNPDRFAWKDGPLAGGGYTYRVVAYQKRGGKVYAGQGQDAYVPVAALAAPGGLEARSDDAYVATLTWGAVPGADGYNIYRAASAEGPYGKAIAKVGQPGYVDEGVAGGTWYYKVEPYDKIGRKTMAGNTAVSSTYVDVLSGPTLEVLSGTPTLYKLTLAWSWGDDTPPANCTGYYIYRATVNDGEPGFEDSFKLVKTITGRNTLSWELRTGLEDVHSFRVAARYSVNGKSVAGSYHQGSQSPAGLSAPDGMTLTESGLHGAKVKWTPLRENSKNLASGYLVYRSDWGDAAEGTPGFEGSFKLVKTVVGGGKDGWTDANLTGEGYWYRVAGYLTVGGRKMRGDLSEPAYIKTSYRQAVENGLLVVPEAGFEAKTLKADGASEGLHAARVYWQPVKEASGYYIYHRSGDADGDYRLAATVKKGATASARLTGLPAGDNYFMIAPYFTAGKSTIKGAATGPSAACAVAPLALSAAPTATARAGSYNTLAVSWPRVSGATGYYVDCAETGTRHTVKNGSKSTITFTHAPLEAGSYTYTVTPYYKAGKALLEGTTSAASVAAAVNVAEMPQPEPGAWKAETLDPVGVKLSWWQSADASGYNIYRRATPTGLDEEWELVKSQAGKTKTTYTDWPPDPNVTGQDAYAYKVVPYRTVKNKKMEGVGTEIYPEAALAATCGTLAKVADAPTATVAANKGKYDITVGWQAADGAQGYYLYKAYSPDGPGTLVATKKGNGATSHKLSGQSAGEAWYYVVAWYKGGSVTYTAPASPRGRVEAG